MSNFAPYYSDAPEIERARSPPLRSPRESIDRTRSPPLRPAQVSRNISEIVSQPLPPPESSSPSYDAESGPRHRDLEVFQTSLPLRMDVEAMLAYILLPPAGGVMLLLLEHKSDYVRFHAWQGSMLFTVIFILHLLLAWSKFLSWTLFMADIAIIIYLARRAYIDVDTLEHYQIPIIGRVADRFVDDE